MKTRRRHLVRRMRCEHTQRPPECCRTHQAAAAELELPCWDCETLALADHRLGLAILLGYGTSGIDGINAEGPSVLECLIAAETVMALRTQHTRGGAHAARPL